MSNDDHDPAEPDEERPDVGDIPKRPASPAVIRFLGCQAEMAGLSTDYFTVGRTDDCDLRIPDELGGGPSVLLRFSRGAEGWRVSPAENQPVFVNQEQVRTLTPLRSGDVIRFVPGGAGMQFNIVHQNATPLASLVAKHAPRLLGGGTGPAGPSPAGPSPAGDDSVVDGMAPLRYEAGDSADQPTRPAPAATPNPQARKLDPAVLVAGSILLAGVIAGAAFLYGTSRAPDAEEPQTPVGQPAPTETQDITTPDGTPVELLQDEPPEAAPPDTESPSAETPSAEPPIAEPSSAESPGAEAPNAETPTTGPPPPAPNPQPEPPVDPEELIDDPFG